jgi:hypothetical protein
MKRFALTSILFSTIGYAACTADVAPTTIDPNAGSSGTGGKGGGNTAGTSTSSGGSGGSAAGTGGSAGSQTAGSGGSAGSVGGAGGAGTGNTAGGGTGNTAGGGMGNMAGGGSGNMAGGGAGGMPGGSSGSAGAGNASGAGGGGSGGTGPTCPSVEELFPAEGDLGSLDGRLVTTPCSPTNSDDCSGGGWIYNGDTTPCMNGALNVEQDFPVGGTPGAMYEVTLHFYGVVEPKNYGNMVTREAGNSRPMHGANGAMPAPWASANGGVSYPASDYNTYELHVYDESGEEVREYFLNSDTTEGHWTYLLNYERTIPVIGGGKIRARTYDRNCRMIKNCGDRSGGVSFSSCSSATKQTVDVSAAMPAPTDLQQPGLGQAAAESGQWLLIDVTEVTCP